MAPSQDIYLVGNIASGKTTLAKLLAEHIPGSVYVPEPYERNPFLPLYLQDQQRWAFTSTLRYYMDYVQVLSEQKTANPQGQYFFIDAGSWSNALLYARYAAGEGMMTPQEYAFYREACRVFDIAYPQPQPAAFIFISASPEICYQRMRGRGWGFQQNVVQVSYLMKLDEYLLEMKRSLLEMGVKVLEISSEGIPFHRPDGIDAVLAWAKSNLSAITLS